MDFNSLHSKLEYLKSQVHSGEELVSLRLDSSRNELLVANIVLCVVSCSIGLSSYISSLFGMSLDNEITIPYTKEIFFGVSGVTMVLIPLVSIAILSYLKRHRILPTRASVHSAVLSSVAASLVKAEAPTNMVTREKWEDQKK